MIRISAASTLLITILHSSLSLANAGGGAFKQYEVATPDMGASYAGAAARAGDAGTAYLNPAGMTLLENGKIHSLVGGLIKIHNLEFEVDNAAIAVPSAARGNGGSAGAVTPGFALYFVKSLNRCLALGFTINDPYSTKIKYGEGWIGRNYITEMTFRGINFEPSLAYQIAEDLSLGLGINLVYGYLPTYRLKASALQSSPNIELEGRDWDWGFTIGGLYQYTRYTHIGLTYQSSIKFHMDNTVRMPVGTIAYLNSKTKFAQGVNLSLSHEYSEKLKVLADLGWSDWSAMSLQHFIVNATLPIDINRHWRDTWRVAGGFEYQWDDCLLFRTGISYDTNPTRKSSSFPDAPFGGAFRFSLGFSLNLLQGYVLSGSYTYLKYRDVTIDNVILPLGAVLKGQYSPAAVHYLGATISL